MESTGYAPTKGKKRAAVALLFIALCLLAYLPALRAGFVWDDDAIINNPLLKTGRGLWNIWTAPSLIPQGHYWPLLYTSFWVEYQLWGARPFGYHLVNVLLHGLGCFILFLVLRRLKIPGALAAALLYSLHPVQVESVAWIMERKNVLSGVFFFAAILAFVHYEEKGKRKLYYIALGFFLCALLTKTSVVGLPLVLMVLLWWKRDRLEKEDALILVPFFALAAAFSLFDILAVRDIGYKYDLSFMERSLIAGRAVWFYIAKLFRPAGLMPVYPKWSIETGNPVQYIYPLGVLVFLFVLYALRNRIGKGAVACFAYFIIMLAPVLGFVDFGFMGYSWVADHFQYLASAGIVVLVCAGASKLAERRGFAVRAGLLGLFTLILLIFGISTWRHSRHFQNLEILFRYNLDKNSQAAVGHANVGAVLYQKGDVGAAISRFQRAIEIQPHLVDAHLNLGIVYMKQGKYEKALEKLEAAVELSPNHEKSRYNLARVLYEMNDLEKAARHFREVVRINPGNAAAHNLLGVAYARMGNEIEAEKHFKEAIRIHPDFARAHNNLGILLSGRGDLKKAEQHYRRAIENTPDSPDFHYNLFENLNAQGRKKEARDHLEKAIELAEKQGREDILEKAGEQVEIPRIIEVK